MYSSIPIEKIVPCPHAISREGNDNIEELVSDIKERGLMAPLCVRPAAQGVFEAYAGRRRLAALTQIGVQEVPCKVSASLDDLGAKIESLSENLHRRPLSAADKFRALHTIIKLCGDDVEAAAKKAGIGKATLRAYLQMRENLDPEVLDKLDSGELPMDAAMALSKADKDKQGDILDECGSDAKDIRKEASKDKKKRPKGPWVWDENEQPLAIPQHLFGKVLQLIRAS